MAAEVYHCERPNTMPRCTSCGHDSPDHYQFCLNCGTKLARSTGHISGPTPGAGEALPIGSLVCQHCGTQNAAGMHYCSHCGRAIGLPTMAASGNGTPLASAPTPIAPRSDPEPPRSRSPRPTPVPHFSSGDAIDGSLTIPAPAEVAGGPPPAAGQDDLICPHCSGKTPVGYRFCQRCGKPIAEPEPGGITTSAGAHGQVAEAAQRLRSQQAEQAAPPPGPPPSDSGAAIRSARWGTMVCLNRDGTQGAEHPLAGEYVDIGSEGQSGCQISFVDPFLAPRHLRLEREAGKVWLTALDRTNGVFLRIADQVALDDHAILLLGRELLRFDLLGPEERDVSAATQHGVRIFGSPVRDAWGRLSQILPNACVRDVRHLIGVEVIIGREEGDVVFADDEFLSRRHASLHWRDERCYLEDLGSSNGSFVRVTSRIQVVAGTQLRFGDQVVRIDL
jgi:pSer/pThr/pTyr-binding forkhead associated (FHA) protein